MDLYDIYRINAARLAERYGAKRTCDVVGALGMRKAATILRAAGNIAQADHMRANVVRAYRK